MTLARDVVDRCLRALSPYDCRRHYAALAARHSDRREGPADAPVPCDLFGSLTAAQRRAVEAGVAGAARRCIAVREREDLDLSGARRYATAAAWAAMSREEQLAFKERGRRESEERPPRQYAKRGRLAGRGVVSGVDLASPDASPFVLEALAR